MAILTNPITQNITTNTSLTGVAGKFYVVKNTGTAYPTVTAGSLVYTIEPQGSIALGYDGTNWYELSGRNMGVNFASTFVYARSAGAQSCANGTTTLIFGTETDPGGNYNAATGEYTVPSTGYYDVSAGCNMAAAAWTNNDSLRIGVYLDGTNTSMIGDLSMQGANTFVARVRGSGIISCTAGQVLTIQLTHNQGGAVNTSGAAATDYLRVMRVA